MENPVITALEAWFNGQGFASLRFNFRGVPGRVESYAGIPGATEDAKSALIRLKELLGTSKAGVVGYSFGGSTALCLALHEPVAFVITMSASRALLDECGSTMDDSSRPAPPTLMFHGTNDRTVPFNDMSSIAGQVGNHVRQVPISGEGHFYMSGIAKLTSHLSEFLSEYHLLPGN
jgi:alpha/beta superfamily hydrolase